MCMHKCSLSLYIYIYIHTYIRTYTHTRARARTHTHRPQSAAADRVLCGRTLTANLLVASETRVTAKTDSERETYSRERYV